MAAHPTPTPGLARLDDALGRHGTLAALLERVQESRRRLDRLRPLLPPGLAPEVRAGPLDDKRWVLLVGSAATAARLRHLVPDLQAAAAERGENQPIKVRVLPR